jgi:hypothetical protein
MSILRKKSGKHITFTIALKILKYLRINLMVVADLYNENCKSLKKEIYKDIRRQKGIS